MSMAGFSVSDKATKESSGIEAVDLGVNYKLQSNKLLVPRKMMMVHHENHDHRPFSPYAIGYGDVHADGPTPTGNNDNNNNRPKTCNIYDVFPSSDSGDAAAAAVASGGAVGVRTMQPFDISPTTTTTSNIAYTAFKSPAGMAASLEFPFTFAQLKELERQAMVFKYMKASIPVPPDLLIPITGSPSSVTVASHSALPGVGGALNLRFSGRAGDLEPGRCRRTDGKKWRCARDVAPDQKYCERHMHRGRPRSRKHVELSNQKTRHTHSPAALPSSSSSIFTKNASQSHFVKTLSQPFHQNQTTCFLDKPSDRAAAFWPLTSVSSYKDARNSDWIMNDELIPPADQQWHHLMQIGPTTGSSFSSADNSSVLNQNYSDKQSLNLNSYANFNATEDQQSNNCPLFLNSEMVPLEKSPEVAARGFIDAWSTGVSKEHNANSGAETSVSSNGKLSLSSLALSMGVNNMRDDEKGPTHMVLGVIESDQNHEYASKSHLSSRLAPASWAASTPGGPLAEVLRPSKMATAATAAEGSSNPSSPITGNGTSCSPPVTVVSSPSGVLQRTLVSLSDSSCSSSPTLPSSGAAKQEIGFMWFKKH